MDLTPSFYLPIFNLLPYRGGRDLPRKFRRVDMEM